MRNRNATLRLSDASGADPTKSAKPVVLKRFRVGLTALVDWLRAGYPEEAPRTGHSPLLALHGPQALTSAQKSRISDSFEGPVPNPIDVAVAITKVTDRLPTPTQAHAVSRALRHRQ